MPKVVHVFEIVDGYVRQGGIVGSLAAPVIFPLGLLLSWFVCILVHELGHVVGGTLVRYNLEMLLVWPFLFIWRDGKRIFRVLNRSDLLGFAQFQIPDLTNFTPRYAIFIGGGPVANLLFAATCGVFRTVSHGPAFHELLGTMGVISAGIGLLNFIPFRSGVHSTDGSKLLMLAFQPERMRRLQAVIQLRSLTFSGISPKDWPETVVKQAISAGAENAPERYHLFLFGYVWAGAKDDTQLAAECLEQCLRSSKSAGRSSRNFLALEAAIFQAWYRRDAAKSRTWKLRVKNLKTVSGYSKLRLKICEACLESRYQDAIAEVESFAGNLGKRSSTPTAELLKRSWFEWKLQIEERAAAAKVAASQ